ncbi:hypothetical protein C8Q80DRAFT_1123297 [Daedaleopsis nitida]|nr:hypothetical protein C8Q80DRAFT_1123297 [Daedaleopsis nitida]
MLAVLTMSGCVPYLLTEVHAQVLNPQASPCSRVPKMSIHEYLPPVRRGDIAPNDALFFEMPLDHFGGTTGTFKNRYWVNDTYHKPGGPVFRVFAILWEHRFYGDSMPFTVNTVNASDGRAPCIWLGGSYPGVRGGLLRVRKPETIFAVWASPAYYAAANMKFRLLSARGGGVTREEAANASAAGVLMDSLWFYQYYEFEASVLPFCNVLETRNFTATPFDTGIAAALGDEAGLDAFLTAILSLHHLCQTGDPATVV